MASTPGRRPIAQDGVGRVRVLHVRDSRNAGGPRFAVTRDVWVTFLMYASGSRPAPALNSSA
ncbi:DUF397 domain-containing protein [Streptomyces sp. TE5632]